MALIGYVIDRTALAALIVFASLSLLHDLASAQERMRDPGARWIDPGRVQGAPRVWMVRGEGEPAPELDPTEPDPPPRRLTLDEKSALVAGLGQLDLDLGPWSVTPANPIIANRIQIKASLADHFWPHLSPPTLQFTDPLGQQIRGEVSLLFLPPALRRYLIECSVSPPSTISSTNPTYQVRVYPGGVEQAFANTGHLTFVYEAVNTSALSVRITAPEYPYAWNFYGCEVTPLE